MANNLVSKVELIISCRNLLDADLLSKSDPMVVLFIKHGTKHYIEYGRTEVVMNNLNPDFNKAFLVDYYFEEIQQLKFQVYDIDSSSPNLSEHDFLGEFKCNLGELVSRANVEGNLVGHNVKGKIVIRCSEISSCKELFTMQFSASGLPKRGWWIFSGKCNPFLEIHRVNGPHQFTGEEIRNPSQFQFVLAHRTEHIWCTDCPQWKPFQVRNWRLCQGDRDKLLRIDCYNWRHSGSYDLIGSFYTSINDLLHNIGKSDHLQLINFQDRKKFSHASQKGDCGRVTVNQFQIDSEFTFVDYISSGTQLHFTVAVDFTASNGPQNNPISLHYVHQNYPHPQLNQYETAISSVGRIIEDYDYDKMFPAVGFGAKIPPAMALSHCFPLSFQSNNPFCYRVEGLLQAYKQAVREVQLFGPTNFAPCIRHVQRFAEAHQDGSQYFVLLIITDGIITDIDKTIDSIVDCSFLPMSIIIVGVGNEDFSTMNMLDCDNGYLRSGFKVADRDIVQFVPLRDFVNSNESLNNQANLARSVLAELPDQVVLWMRKHRIVPKSAPLSTIGLQSNQPHGDVISPPYPINPIVANQNYSEYFPKMPYPLNQPPPYSL